MALRGDVVNVYEGIPTAYQATLGHVAEVGFMRRYLIVRALVVGIVCAVCIRPIRLWLLRTEPSSSSAGARTILSLAGLIILDIEQIAALLANSFDTLGGCHFRHFFKRLGVGAVGTFTATIVVRRFEIRGIPFFESLAALLAGNGYLTFGRVLFWMFSAILHVTVSTTEQGLRTVGFLFEVFAALFASASHIAILAIIGCPVTPALARAKSLAAVTCKLFVAPFAVHNTSRELGMFLVWTDNYIIP